MSDTTDTVGVAGDRIRSIIERIERIDEEIKDLTWGSAKVERPDLLPHDQVVLPDCISRANGSFRVASGHSAGPKRRAADGALQFKACCPQPVEKLT